MVKKKKLLICLILILLLISIGNFAFARNIASYDLILPRGGMTYTYTAPLVKTTTGIDAVDNNSSIGGKYDTQISRIIYGTSAVSKTFTVTEGSRIRIPYNSSGGISLGQKGNSYRLSVRSQFGTPVRVQTRGSWSPDHQ